MTPRQWFLLVALVCASALVVLDLNWFGVDGDRHLPTWLGLSLAAYYVSLLVRDR